MSRFRARATPLAGLVVLERTLVEDARGSFSRLFCAQALGDHGWTRPIAQVNHARTARRGTVRGLHFQLAPHAEMKLVSCLRGAVWDVAVDVRPESPTFLQWHAELLSQDNHCSMLIPEGFAHGFQAQTHDVEMLYCHSAPHAPASEAGLHPRDRRLAIPWPLPIALLSERDDGFPLLAPDYRGGRP